MPDIQTEITVLSNRWNDAFPSHPLAREVWSELLVHFHPDVIHRKLRDVKGYRSGIAFPEAYLRTAVYRDGPALQVRLGLTALFKAEEFVDEEVVTKRHPKRSMSQVTLLRQISHQRKAMGKKPLPKKELLTEVRSLYRDGKGIMVKNNILLVGPVAHDFVAAKVAL